MLDGSSWVRNTAVMSSTGSTQNAVLAAPPHDELADRDSTLSAAGSCTHREAEPETDAVEGGLGEERPAEGLEVDTAGEVVQRHVAHRAGPEQPHAVELAAAAQHLVNRW